ncbi:hypothetical protein [Pantoea sp. KPR_PJ]
MLEDPGSFISTAQEEGTWVYLVPDDVLMMEHLPVSDVEAK